MERCFTCKQVAEYFGVKTLTIWQWIRDGKLNAINTGKNYAISPQSVREFEEARATRK